jgi:hypothetical protein
MMDSGKQKFLVDLKRGKIGENAVCDRLQFFEDPSYYRKDVRDYMVKMVGNRPEFREQCVDVIQSWSDSSGQHMRWHEVKGEMTQTMDGQNRNGDTRFQDYFAPWTLCDEYERSNGTGNLFIETESLVSGDVGWYYKFKECSRDKYERYIWFVLIKYCKDIDDFMNGQIEFIDLHESRSWRNNVMIRVPAKNFVEIFDSKYQSYKIRDNGDKTARARLMPVTDLWKCPQKYKYVWTDSNGVQRIALADGVMSDTCTGSNAILYQDSSRTAELFRKK